MPGYLCISHTFEIEQKQRTDWRLSQLPDRKQISQFLKSNQMQASCLSTAPFVIVCQRWSHVQHRNFSQNILSSSVVTQYIELIWRGCKCANMCWINIFLLTTTFEISKPKYRSQALYKRSTSLCTVWVIVTETIFLKFTFEAQALFQSMCIYRYGSSNINYKSCAVSFNLLATRTQ